MPNKKIYMILTNGFDPDFRVLKEAIVLRNEGYEIEIICWDRKGDYKDQTYCIRDDGIIIKRMYIPSKPGTGIKQLIPFFKFMKRTKAYLNGKEYLCLHCHDFDGVVIGNYVQLLKKKSIIFDMHECYKSKIYYKIRFAFQHFINISKFVIHVNDEQINDWSGKDKAKCVFLPNYPEVKYFLPIEKILHKDSINVNYVGTVRDYNAINTLVETSNKVDKIKIGIYGNGLAYERLKQENKKENVTIYGRFDATHEIGNIYRNTDLLYCVFDPENYNWKTSFPTKLFEAIITRTPVIVSKNTVASDFVQKNKIGESVPYMDAEALSNAINKIISNYNFYKENLCKISKEYQWEDISKKLVEMYKKV